MEGAREPSLLHEAWAYLPGLQVVSFGLVYLTVKSDTAMLVVSEAMAEGSHCDRLEALELTNEAPVSSLLALLSALAKGECPHLIKLSLALPSTLAEDLPLIRALGESLESRMDKGRDACKPLKSLESLEGPHQPPYFHESCPLSLPLTTLGFLGGPGRPSLPRTGALPAIG